MCVNVWYLFFSFWLTPLCVIGCRFIHLIRTDSNVFLFMAEQYSIVYTYHSFFIHSFVDGHLGCFHVPATVNNAAMNIGIHVSFSVLASLEYMPRSGIAGSYGVTEKAMAPHSSTLAWRIPWMEEPGRLQSMGSRRVGHNWATSLSLFTLIHWRRKWQPTPVFLPGESQGRGSLVGCCLWGRTESDTTEVT